MAHEHTILDPTLSMKSTTSFRGRGDDGYEATSLRHLAFVSVLLDASQPPSMPDSGAGLIEVCEFGSSLAL